MASFLDLVMHDRADDHAGAILPQPSRPHAFQRSDFNTRCALDGCGEKGSDPIHIGARAHYWRKHGWWRFPGQF
jgi:hypothetical protein